jgi:hypothetical protein
MVAVVASQREASLYARDGFLVGVRGCLPQQSLAVLTKIQKFGRANKDFPWRPGAHGPLSHRLFFLRRAGVLVNCCVMMICFDI